MNLWYDMVKVAADIELSLAELDSSAEPKLSKKKEARAGKGDAIKKTARPKEMFSDAIGERLQVLRKHYGLSQRELARRADVTNSTLSMIEQGKVSPSIGSLEKILHAFPVSLQEFFSNNELSSDVVLRADQLVNVQHSTMLQTLLPPYTSHDEVQMLKQELPPHSKTSSGWTALKGFISGMVVQGEMSLVVEGIEYSLQQNDVFQFSLNREHSFENTSLDPCVLMSVIYT